MVNFSKRAVSPLIATVLLIVVTISIGAVVTGVVRGYITENKQVIEKTATDTQCSNSVQITVPVIADAYRMCYTYSAGSGVVNFTLENSGSMLVDDLQVKVYGTSGFNAIDGLLPSGLASGMTDSTLSVPYSGIGTIQEIHIIPKKKVSSSVNKIFCEEAKLVFSVSDIALC